MKVTYVDVYIQENDELLNKLDQLINKNKLIKYDDIS